MTSETQSQRMLDLDLDLGQVELDLDLLEFLILQPEQNLDLGPPVMTKISFHR